MAIAAHMGEGTEAFWKAECAYLSLQTLRTRQRTSAVASVRPCCGMPCAWPCVSQSLREAPAVGSTAPHRRAAVVYLPPPLWTAVNKWRRTDSRGSMGTLTLGFADGGHGWYLLLLTQLLSFFWGGCFIYPVIVPQVSIRINSCGGNRVFPD